MFNNSYLDRTPNKDDRGDVENFTPKAAVSHETAGGGTLDHNLNPAVRASFNYLITRDGTIYHYVNERSKIAWHAGIGPKGTVGGVYYGGKSRYPKPTGGGAWVGAEVNINTVGIELEGPADGTPCTDAQKQSYARLMIYFRDVYGIPIDKRYYLPHSAIAPVYRGDPKGYTVEDIIERAKHMIAAAGTPAERFAAAHAASGGDWRGTGLLSAGLKLGEPFMYAGTWHQHYERGVARLEGDTVIWLLLREIMNIPD
jgi:hypothetical protein